MTIDAEPGTAPAAPPEPDGTADAFEVPPLPAPAPEPEAEKLIKPPAADENSDGLHIGALMALAGTVALGVGVVATLHVWGPMALAAGAGGAAAAGTGIAYGTHKLRQSKKGRANNRSGNSGNSGQRRRGPSGSGLPRLPKPGGPAGRKTTGGKPKTGGLGGGRKPTAGRSAFGATGLTRGKRPAGVARGSAFGRALSGGNGKGGGAGRGAGGARGGLPKLPRLSTRGGGTAARRAASNSTGAGAARRAARRSPSGHGPWQRGAAATGRVSRSAFMAARHSGKNPARAAVIARAAMKAQRSSGRYTPLRSALGTGAAAGGAVGLLGAKGLAKGLGWATYGLGRGSMWAGYHANRYAKKGGLAGWRRAQPHLNRARTKIAGYIGKRMRAARDRFAAAKGNQQYGRVRRGLAAGGERATAFLMLLASLPGLFFGWLMGKRAARKATKQPAKPAPAPKKTAKGGVPPLAPPATPAAPTAPPASTPAPPAANSTAGSSPRAVLMLVPPLRAPSAATPTTGGTQMHPAIQQLEDALKTLETWHFEDGKDILAALSDLRTLFGESDPVWNGLLENFREHINTGYGVEEALEWVKNAFHGLSPWFGGAVDRYKEWAGVE